MCSCETTFLLSGAYRAWHSFLQAGPFPLATPELSGTFPCNWKGTALCCSSRSVLREGEHQSRRVEIWTNLVLYPTFTRRCSNQLINRPHLWGFPSVTLLFWKNVSSSWAVETFLPISFLQFISNLPPDRTQKRQSGTEGVLPAIAYTFFDLI